MKKKGFSPIAIIIIIAAIVAAGIRLYLSQKSVSVPLAAPTSSSSISFSPTPLSGEKKCVVSGCNREICQAGDAPPLASICIYNPEYACYKTAQCAVQKNGTCGWTQDAELARCIEKARTPTPTPTPTHSPSPTPKICTPPVECPAPPVNCNYKESDSCTCGRLVCTTPSPTPLPSFSPTPSPSPQTPTPAPTPAAQTFIIKANDYGFTPSGPISVSAGVTVQITFNVDAQNVYYGGLDFRSSKFQTGTVPPGGSKTVEFTTDSSFAITSYWPASGVRKADISVEVK